MELPLQIHPLGKMMIMLSGWMSQIIEKITRVKIQNLKNYLLFKFAFFRKSFVAQHIHTEKGNFCYYHQYLRNRAMPILLSAFPQSHKLPFAQKTAIYPDF